jgi:anti-sigma factor RsiW
VIQNGSWSGRTITTHEKSFSQKSCNFYPADGSVFKAAKTMKCEELLAMLNEYVDGTVDPAVCEEFEKHMAGCNPCQVVVDNIRQTITLYKEGKPYELPLQFRQRLHSALRQRWNETHGTKP